MAFVICLGRKGIEVVGIDKNVVRSYDNHLFRQPEDLSSQEDFKSLLEELKDAHPELKDEAVYLLLHAGCGLQYKVFTVNQDSLMVSGSTTTAEQQAEALMDACIQKIPSGLTGTFVPAVFSDYLQETDYVVSCAYFYESMLNNITAAFSAAELNLFDIAPFSFGIFKSLDNEKFAQVIIDLPEEMLLVNNIGVIGWTKPHIFSKSLANAFLIGEAHRHYGIDNSMVQTTIVSENSFEGLVYDSLVNKSGSNAFAVYAAFGLINGGNIKKEGGMKDAVNKLRQLFNKGKEE